VGGAERNARKKKQEQLAAKAVVAARGSSGGDRNKIIIGVVVVVVLAIGVISAVLLNKPSTPEALTPPVEVKTVAAPVQRQDATVLVGKDTAKVTVDVYEDFLCPVCGTFEKTYGPKLREQVEAGTVRVRYHVLPLLVRLSDPEGYSRDSANAALCAADAGKFTEYHDSLFAKQPKENGPGYTKEQLVKLGTDLGITGSTFKTCVDGGTYDQAVEAELDKADAAPHLQVERSNGTKGFRGTPTVAVGDKLISLDNENWISDLLKG
jgi:protein-disulfide isomerase